MLIVNAVVFDGREFQKGLHLRLEGGVIVETGEFLSPGEGEEVLDLGGDFLVPGFVDVHIHAFRGHDTMDGEEAVRAMSRDLAGLGVAAFCPTTMSASPEETKNALRGIRQIMKRPEENGARILGAHMEAPFLREERAGAQRKEFFRDPSWEDFLWMTDGHPEIVSLITLAPERAGSEGFIRKAAAAGIHVSIGHTSADAETVHAAADWGADHVTHTFNAQTPVHHRKPGVPGAAGAGGRGGACGRDGGGAGQGQPDGQKVIVQAGQARLADGTLAGSVLTMPKALENLIHIFGIAPEAACAMCTAAPAASVHETAAGRIIPGAPGILTRWTREWKHAGVIRV